MKVSCQALHVRLKKKNQCKQGDKKIPIKLSLYFLKSYVFKISSKN
jgi:hypothetical protein